MKVLFLDCDGVLNGHERNAHNAYSGVRPDCMERLNRVLAVTGCRLVISSAWRYLVLRGAMTLKGFDYLLCTHGIRRGGGRIVIGCTPSDEEIPDRGGQVLWWVRRSAGLIGVDLKSWAVVDDDPIGMSLGEHQHRLMKTDGTKGLTDEDADRLIEILGREAP